MKKLIIILGLCAAFAASGAANLTNWQQAVKPDAPETSSVQTTIYTNAIGSAPLFYSASNEWPPLPFNPHPELDLYDLGDNRFMFDDTAMETSFYGGGGMMSMASPSPCDPCSTNGNGGESQSFSGPPAYGYASSNLWVKITNTNASNSFRLDVMNTVSGTTYGVLAKSSVDTDPFNTWTLVNVFQATSTNQALFGTATAATRFYSAVNLDAYTGPTVSIISPTAGTTVSNDVVLQVRVTDILPLVTLKVYVDAIQVGAIVAGKDGTITVPSYLFANGSHQIWVQAANAGVSVDSDGDGFVDDTQTFLGGVGVTVNFTNEVTMVNYSPLYSGSSSLTLNYAVRSPQDYTFKVLQTNGTLLHTTNGTSSGGSISRTWNYTDLSGSAVTNGVYVFSLTYTQHTSGFTGQAAVQSSKTIVVTNFVDNGVSVGKYVVSYGCWPQNSYNVSMSNMNAYVSTLVNSAAFFNDDIIGSNREDYNTIYVDFHSDPFPIRKNTQTNDIIALTNALKDSIVGSWLFEGHAAVDNLVHGKDQYLTVDLPAKKLAEYWGNPYSNFILSSNGGPVIYNLNYKRRLFSTILTGCSTAVSDWPDVTGTPPGIDQENNSQIRKTAFIGFVNLSEVGDTKNGWINRIHYEWIDGDEYNTEISTALWRANLAYPAVTNWGPTLYGHSFLGYRASESR